MELRRLGAHGPEVPVVGMGTWKTFDVRGERALRARRAVVDAALASGTRLFDTSPMYGASEHVLAAALAGRRDAALVALKVWAPTAGEGRAQIARALDAFAGRVEVYQIHNLLAWRTHLPALRALRARGATSVVGATHYQHSAFGELMSLMRSGDIGLVQVPYNVEDRVVERDVLPLAEALGLGVLVMKPLGTGRLVRTSPRPADLAPLEPFGVRTWAQALLKWILSDRRVHAVLPATHHAERARENGAAGSAPWFDDETRDYVARLATAGRP